MEDAIKTESIDELLTFLTRNLSVQEKTEFIEEIQKKTKYIEDDFDQDEVCERFDEWIDSELKHIPITSVEIDCKTDLPIAHTYERFAVLISTAEFSYNSALSSMREQLCRILNELIDVIHNLEDERWPIPLRFKMQTYYRQRRLRDSGRF